jgi:glycine/D-amino acid oxidase-like deaminating enzyme
MERFDTVVLGGGVIGTSTVAHLAMLGAGRVALIEKSTLGAGTTAQSSCILRTHYSVREDFNTGMRPRAVERALGVHRRLTKEGAGRLAPQDVAGCERLARYLLRPPLLR